MAVDTAQKRADATQLLHAFYGPIIIPDASLTQPDRQSAANIYSGILAGESPVVVEEDRGLQGGKPEKKKRRKSLYPDVDLPKIGLPQQKNQPESGKSDIARNPEQNPPLTAVDLEIKKYLEEIYAPIDRIMERNIAMDEQRGARQRRNMLAAMILLLD